MRTDKFENAIRAATTAALLAVVLAACEKPAPQVAPPELTAPPVPPAVPDAPPAESLPTPSPDAPPPTEPSAVPKPASSKEPSVDSMMAAVPSSKMGVAVDLRYSFDGDVLPNQPVIVHLAALPRVSGARLKVSVQQAAGLQMAAGPLNVQKTEASSVYRQQFSLTRQAGTTEPLRVLVIMEVGENSAFGYYTIPIDGGTNAQKQESVKQR